jgi:hypothetical protein
MARVGREVTGSRSARSLPTTPPNTSHSACAAPAAIARSSRLTLPRCSTRRPSAPRAISTVSPLLPSARRHAASGSPSSVTSSPASSTPKTATPAATDSPLDGHHRRVVTSAPMAITRLLHAEHHDDGRRVGGPTCLACPMATADLLDAQHRDDGHRVQDRRVSSA